MVASGLSWLEERDEAIDYTVHLIDAWSTLIAMQSNTKVIQFSVYTDIFSNEVWAFIVIIVVAISCALFVLDAIGVGVLPSKNFGEKILLGISTPLCLPTSSKASTSIDSAKRTGAATSTKTSSKISTYAKDEKIKEEYSANANAKDTSRMAR